MKKIHVSLTALALVAIGAATAVAQGVPSTQPPFLQIWREHLKPGRTADHAKWEEGWPAAYEKVKSPSTTSPRLPCPARRRSGLRTPPSAASCDPLDPQPRQQGRVP